MARTFAILVSTVFITTFLSALFSALSQDEIVAVTIVAYFYTAIWQVFTAPMIGVWLGHSRSQTTARYAHLAANPLLEAAEEIGRKISATQ